MPTRRTAPCVILLLLVLLPLDQALACIPIRSPARDVFHEAQGIYLARFQSGSLYEVIATLQGEEASLVRVPGVMEAVYGCSTQPVPKEGEEYLVVTYCDPADEGTGDAPEALRFSCRANAWPTADNPDYVEFLKRREQVSPSDLIERLRGWEQGKLSLADTATWLADKERHADVVDWTDEEESLTGDLLPGLSRLFELLARCPRQTVGARKAFKARMLPAVITLLGRGSIGPEDPAAENLVDEIFDLASTVGERGRRRGC